MRNTIELQRYLIRVLFLVACTLSACSVKMAYNYLDWILPWYLDDYVTLTEQQEQSLNTSITTFLDWHRSEELPLYVGFISSVKQAQAAPMTSQQVLAFFEEARELWTRLLEKMLPEMLMLARQFSSEQIKEIDAALAADIRDLRKEHGSSDDSKQRRFRQEKLTEALDDWLGSVTGEQLELIRLWSTTRINTTDNWLDYRDEWREKFIRLLQNRNSPEFMSEMSFFLLHPEKSYSRSYHQAVIENRPGTTRLLADISAILTPQQRDHVEQELAGVLSDLTDLTRQGK